MELRLDWVWACISGVHGGNELESLNPGMTQACLDFPPPLEARPPPFLGKSKEWDLFSLALWSPPFPQ